VKKKGMKLPNFIARFSKPADEPPKTEEEKKQLNTKALEGIKQQTAAAEQQNKQANGKRRLSYPSLRKPFSFLLSSFFFLFPSSHHLFPHPELLKTAVKDSKAKADSTSVFDNVAEDEQQRLQKDASTIVDAMKQRQVDKEKNDQERLVAQLAEEYLLQEDEAKRSAVPKYMVNMLTFGRPRINLQAHFGDVTAA
jgi:hypothetical protein